VGLSPIIFATQSLCGVCKPEQDTKMKLVKNQYKAKKYTHTHTHTHREREEEGSEVHEMVKSRREGGGRFWGPLEVRTLKELTTCRPIRTTCYLCDAQTTVVDE
jgi:glutamate synthase domain-containing protein 2